MLYINTINITFGVDTMHTQSCYGKFISEILTGISEIYWSKMFKYIKENSIDYKKVNCFILNPESISIYLSKKYIAIEYCGNPYINDIKEVFTQQVTFSDYSKEDITTKQFIEKIVGFKNDNNINVPLSSNIYEDLVIPTNAGADKLVELNWNFFAQNSIIGINSGGIDILDNQFVRLINCSFFDEQNGDLKTRIIKWIDFIPLEYNEPDEGDVDEFRIDLSVFDKLWYKDMFYQYPKPTEFKYSKLPQINRFIEIFADSSNSETDITSFLSKDENKFILKMGFMGTNIYDQVNCKWQSESKDDIKPDFFIVRANGYADIIEFKLPHLKRNSVVGRINREQFSSEINSYIAQTRVYSEYFDDPNNRRWFENKYGFKVYKPKRYLVVGRRDFDGDDWMKIKSDFCNIEIITYDDLVDTVIAQFYQ